MLDISLKPAQIEDYDDYYAVRSCPGDVYWNGYKDKPNKDDFFELFQKRLGNTRLEKPEDRRIYLVRLHDAGDERSIGFIQLIKRTDGIDISYTIMEKWQRHGYASWALKLGVVQAKQLSDHIYVQIRDDNEASQKVALKCGFVRTDETVVKDYPFAGKVKLRKYQYNQQTEIT